MTGSGQYFDEFIDDYFSECDEHLATVRRVLLSFDEAGPSPIDATRRQELARALHTLKGLSGMVSLAAAEAVAHAMEDVLRAMPAGDAPAAQLVQCLFDGEALLERAVAARRARSAPPSPDAFVARVLELTDAAERVAASPNDAPDATAPRSVQMAVAGLASRADAVARIEHRFEFMPSGALAARGVGVEMTRQRLSSLGEITATIPRVRPTGGVIFEFVVALRPGAVPDDAWRDDGLSWEPWTIESPYEAYDADEVAPAVQAETAVPAVKSNVVRVDLARLDELMRMVGELVVTRARLGASVEHAATAMSAATWEEINEANELIERQLRTIREGVMRIRLVPIGEVFERMRFAMRDLGREIGKSIHLTVSGQDTEIDKLVVDRMLEPLLHLVRNSASHGIESRADRLAAGKPAEGTISLRAQASGDRIVLEVEDDGAGIDVDRVRARAKELGLLDGGATPSAAITPELMLDLICSPGFSTRDSADMSSGRGVGMAVVRSTVRGLGGELFVESVRGRGTRFTIELPLTLMITDALIVEIGDQRMAIPQVALREIVPLAADAVTRFERNEVFSHRGRVVPLVRLAELFKFRQAELAARHVLIVGTEAQPAGLVVDRVVGLREIVVHPVDDPLVAVPGVAGATELADGRVSLILDAPALVRGTRNGRGTHGSALLGAPAASAGALAAPATTATTVRAGHPWS